MISVIIPVYNVEPYLHKCLDSVVNQTYQDLEILVMNEGSTHGSGKKCDKYMRYQRVRVFHTEDAGLSASRNFGFDKAHGEWIEFIDSDDWVEPDYCKLLKEIADIHKAEKEAEYVKQQATVSYLKFIGEKWIVFRREHRLLKRSNRHFASSALEDKINDFCFACIQEII